MLNIEYTLLYSEYIKNSSNSIKGLDFKMQKLNRYYTRKDIQKAYKKKDARSISLFIKAD
jgi:hypothetical protein